MDVEHAIRRMDRPEVGVSLNDENRIMLTLTSGEETLEFVLVEDRLIPWPVKPPAQRVAIDGIDAYRGMGVRG